MQRIDAPNTDKKTPLAKLAPEAVTANIYLCKAKYSDVYVGFFKQQQVAIKVSKRVLNAKGIDVSAECFRKELDVYKQLSQYNHANLLTCLGYIDTENALKLVLEYCEKGALDIIIHSEWEWPWQTRYSMMTEIISAVWFLHEVAKLLHNDIKCANVFITKDNHVKLGDFGFTHSITQLPGTRAGTAQFTAPEVASTGHTSASNVFALGVCLWEIKEWMHSGFKHTTAREEIAAGKREKMSEKPLLLSLLIQSMWAQDPAQRPTITVVKERISAAEFKAQCS